MRKALAPAGALALALTFSACANGDNGDDAEPQNGQEHEPTSEAAALVASINEQIADAGSAQFVFELEVGEEKVTGKGGGDFAAEAPATRVDLDAAGQEAEVRMIDESVFVKLPEEISQLTDDDAEWVDLSQDQQAAQMMGGLDQLAGQGDPASTLAQIEQAGTISETEETELNDQPVTHYTIDVQLSELTDQFPAGLNPEGVQPLQQAGVESYQTEMWVSEDNLPVRFETDLTELYSASAEMGGQEGPDGSSTLSVSYSEWGEPVDVDAPPADAVGQMPEMPQQQPQPGEGQPAPQPGQEQPAPQPQPAPGDEPPGGN